MKCSVGINAAPVCRRPALLLILKLRVILRDLTRKKNQTLCDDINQWSFLLGSSIYSVERDCYFSVSTKIKAA